jgi:peptide-methionine (S)-S-oxide reductase
MSTNTAVKNTKEPVSLTVTPSPSVPSSVSPQPIVVTKKMEEVVVVKSKTPEISNRACFGAGCYWGTEKYFYHDFGKRENNGKIVKGQVGFMGPESAPENPSYKDVCSGSTGHVEVYDLEFEGGADYYEAIVRFFFQFHDPTTFNKQGNDKGTQYASVIYCYDKKQFDIAQKVRSELQVLIDEKRVTSFTEKKVNTDIRMKTIFYPAHAEHQDYLANNPNGYCNHRIRFAEWP